MNSTKYSYIIWSLSWTEFFASCWSCEHHADIPIIINLNPISIPCDLQFSFPPSFCTYFYSIYKEKLRMRWKKNLRRKQWKKSNWYARNCSSVSFGSFATIATDPVERVRKKIISSAVIFHLKKLNPAQLQVIKALRKHISSINESYVAIPNPIGHTLYYSATSDIHYNCSHRKGITRSIRDD